MTAKRLLSVYGGIIAVGVMLSSCDAPAALDPNDSRTPPDMARAMAGKLDLGGGNRLYWSVNAILDSLKTDTVQRASCVTGPGPFGVSWLAYYPRVDANPTGIHSVIMSSSSIYPEVLSQHYPPPPDVFQPELFTIGQGESRKVLDPVTRKVYAGELKVWDITVDAYGAEVWSDLPAIYPIKYRVFKSNGMFGVPCSND